MKLTNALLVLFFTSLATVFALSNTTPVQIGFAGFLFSSAPVYVPVFFAFLIGFLGGMASLAFSRRKHKQEIQTLRQENEQLQQEVDNLRNIPLQDEL